MTDNDISGMQFGIWKVVRRRIDLKNTDLWLCKCPNGHRVNFTVQTLKRNDRVCQYCGNRWNYTGWVKTIDSDGNRNPMYTTWNGIKERCTNKNNKNFKNYGGRGIGLFKEWQDNFQTFFAYVSKLEHFGEQGRTLDRINNDEGYEPGNVRWATAKEQCNNRRPRKKVLATNAK